MHHGSENKGQVVVSKVEGAAICNLQLLSFQVETEEILDHSEGFRVGYDGGFRINFQEVCHICCVVRLHVLYDQVVRLAAFQDAVQIIQPFVSEICIYSIHDCDFFIQDYIGIICHTVRYFVLTFEKVYLMVVYACVADGVCNFHRGSSPFYEILLLM